MTIDYNIIDHLDEEGYDFWIAEQLTDWYHTDGSAGSFHWQSDRKEKCYMDVLDFIHDKFSQDCAIGTVLHLVMAHFDLSMEEAQKKIDEYFEIVEAMDGRK